MNDKHATMPFHLHFIDFSPFTNKYKKSYIKAEKIYIKNHLEFSFTQLIRVL